MFRFLTVLLVAVLVGVDQLTKLIAASCLKGTDGVALIPGVFELEYVENKGAAFGILQNQRWIFIVLTAVIIGGMLFVLLSGRFKGQTWIHVSAAVIIAGGLGNMIDRVFNGYVIDFLYISLIQFPVFNFADCCVVIGAIVLLTNYLFFYKPVPEKQHLTGEGKGDGTETTDTGTAADGKPD